MNFHNSVFEFETEGNECVNYRRAIKVFNATFFIADTFSTFPLALEIDPMRFKLIRHHRT